MPTERGKCGALWLLAMLVGAALGFAAVMLLIPPREKVVIKEVVVRPEPIRGKREAAPQLDRGTFGIFESVAGGQPPFPPYPLAFAWKPQHPSYQDNEIWLFLKLDQMDPNGVPIGFIRPGDGLPHVNLGVKQELKADPPGTDVSDGIDESDYAAFSQWAIGVWAGAYGKPGVIPGDLVLNHHLFGTYRVD